MNCLEFENIKDLEIILSSDVLLSGVKSLIDEEISNNMWCISASSENIKKIDPKKLLAFFDQLLEKRKKQIQELNIACNAIFYVWFDEMACQLRFNIISGCNSKLPFRSKLKFVKNLETIINEFISSRYHDGIPWDELEVYSGDAFCEDEEHDKEYILKVFKKRISIN